MENYKIRVNSEAESKEAKSLLESLGFDIDFSEEGFKYSYLFAYVNGMHVTGDNREVHFKNKNNKEITPPELRDLVVLKRNDVGDATHTDSTIHKRKGYLTCDGVEYFWSYGDFSWKEINIHTFESTGMKPIEKKEMKEYLIKSGDGKYLLTHHDSIGAIEIPEGANFAWKSDGKYVFFTALEMGYRDASVVWSRHTHPEELPFIDDECYTNKSDGVFSLPKSEPCDISNWVEIREEGSLNDQYAEIETVRQSAWQKQEGGSHYKNLKIQPMQYALENKLDYAQANVVKYVTRHADKNGKEDLLKAIHNLELMIEFYYGDEK